MKQRSGFVSNSSSSSFVLVGGTIDMDAAIDYFSEHDAEILEQVKEAAKSRYGGHYDLGESIQQKLTEMLPGWTVHFSDESEYFLLGISLADRKNWDKTVNQLIEEAKEQVKALPNEIRPRVDFEYGEIYS